MSAKFDFDVLYIGAGHGTFDGAAPLAETGVSVGVIENGLIGGTCPNRGCNAKITLDEAVKMTREAERLGDVLQGKIAIDWHKNVAHKQEIIDPLPNDLTKRLEDAGAKIIKGHASFKDNHTVLVDGKTEVTADKIVISTGLKPHRLNIPGTELAHDSEDFMNLQQLPKHLTIIGSGYIGMEFATMANEAGADVTLMLHSDKVLRDFYQPYVAKVVADLKQRGVKFIENSDVKSFVKTDDGYQVNYGTSKLATDWILDATGRIPNVERLGLENVGVKYDASGVLVNDHLQTNVENIYAVGDVISSDQPKVTPAAYFGSKYLMKLFSGQTAEPIQFPVIPKVVFTSPRIAQAGMTVDEAEKKGLDISQNDLAKYWYYVVDKEPIAASKQIHDKEGHLVGVTEISDQAEDAVNALLPAIEFKFDRDQISRLVGLFPTIGYAAWHRA